MPELPEVETVRRGLAPVMEGGVIARAEVNRPDLRWPFPDDMAARLDRAAGDRAAAAVEIHPGRSRIGRNAADPSGHVGAHADFGRPARALSARPSRAEKHDHVVLHMDNGARVTFNDPRRFGAMDLMATATPRRIRCWPNSGPSPWATAFTKPTWSTRSKGARRRSSPRCSISGSLRAWAISMSAKRFTAPGSPRRARRAHLRAARRGAGADHPRRAAAMPSRRADRPCATFARQMGNWVISNTASTFTTARAQPCRTRGLRRHHRRIVQSGRSSFYCPHCQR